MDIVLKRESSIALRDQLRFHLELAILTGELRPAARLPSVRALARRLQIHPNTIAAAYKDLEATGHVEVRRGAGVFVRADTQAAAEGTDLDDIARSAVRQAFRRGFAVTDIRTAVERWIGSAPLEQVVLVDPAREMAELLAEEVRRAVGGPVVSHTLLEVERNPALLTGALVLALPFHVDAIARSCAAAAVEPVHLVIPEEPLAAVEALRPGSLLLVVSHAPTVLPFAEVLLGTLCGKTLRFHVRPVTATRDWRPLVPVADLVVGDVCCLSVLREAGCRRLLEARLVSGATIDRLRALMAVLGRTPVPA